MDKETYLIKYFNKFHAPNGRERFVFLLSPWDCGPNQPYEVWLEANVGNNWYYMSLERLGVNLALDDSWNSMGLVILDRTNATFFMMSGHASGYYRRETVL